MRLHKLRQRRLFCVDLIGTNGSAEYCVGWSQSESFSSNCFQDARIHGVTGQCSRKEFVKRAEAFRVKVGRPSHMGKHMVSNGVS
mmetsp:Transcript_50839/g.80660  ORF Transcript_50839/g.80660 Transcript_50839/m.80660 type:complete len:85 (-) Transcript_50839:3-257(-)